MGQEASSNETHAFTVEVCKGNPEAIAFCNLWYQLCHQIDDLVDCKEDGRPTMSNEDIIAIWAVTALMYNCNYYRKYQTMLFPVVLSVTNLWGNSVAWEKSPIPHRRTIADVLRTVGDHMYFMVAMIEGGWNHMRSVTDRITERDYVLQHDSDGNPI